MFFIKCGKEIEDGTAFCRYCGTAATGNGADSRGPNFTFSRNDSVYTPTYATPAKMGERYYFIGDVMTCAQDSP